MKRMKKMMWLCVVLLVVLAAVGCGKGSENSGNQEPVKEPVKEVTIAYISMANMAPQALTGIDEGIFEEVLGEQGIAVNWVLTRSLDKIWPMMDAGEVDFAYLPAQNVGTYITETSQFGGSDLFRVIAGSMSNNSYTLMVAPGVESLEELDGKTVGIVNYFYMEEMMLNKQLEKVGLKTKAVGGTMNVEYQDMMNDLFVNFENGKYNAITAWNTMIGSVEERVQGSKVLLNLNDGQVFGERNPQKWLMAKKEFIDNEPEVVKLVLKAHLSATERAVARLAELPAMSKLRYDDFFENTLKAQEYPKFPDTYYEAMWEEAMPLYDPDLGFIQELTDFMIEAGYLQGKTVENFVDVTLLNEVLAEEGLPPVQ